MPNFSSQEPVITIGGRTASLQLTSQSGISVQVSVAVPKGYEGLEPADREAQICRVAAEALVAAACELRRSAIAEDAATSR
jgi:hypothetical protein